MTKSRSSFGEFFTALKQHRSGLLGFLLLVILFGTALFADFIAPMDPTLQDLTHKFIPPLWYESGQWPYLFGTDVLGRDIFSRLVYGARISLTIGSLAVAVGALLGIPLGMLAGYFGGRFDRLVIAITNILMAMPSLLLAVCIVAILGPSLQNAILSIGFVAVPSYIRISRSRMLSEKQKEYITADISLGRGHWGILFKAALPNLFSPIMVVATLSFGGAILDAAGLSFIGLGAQPPTPEWGALITEGKTYLFQAPWLIFFPGLAILFTVLGFNLLGDALNDIIDPKNKV